MTRPNVEEPFLVTPTFLNEELASTLNIVPWSSSEMVSAIAYHTERICQPGVIGFGAELVSENVLKAWFEFDNATNLDGFVEWSKTNITENHLSTVYFLDIKRNDYFVKNDLEVHVEKDGVVENITTAYRAQIRETVLGVVLNRLPEDPRFLNTTWVYNAAIQSGLIPVRK